MGMARTLDKNHGIFEFKKLESERGSLVYVMRTYPAMKPYLRGIHATLDSWHPDRDKDGWKMPPKKKQKGNREADVLAPLQVEDLHGYEDDCTDWCDKWTTPRPLNHGNNENDGDEEGNKAPARVRAVPRLTTDVEALLELSSAEAPPK